MREAQVNITRPQRVNRSNTDKLIYCLIAHWLKSIFTNANWVFAGAACADDIARIHAMVQAICETTAGDVYYYWNGLTNILPNSCSNTFLMFHMYECGIVLVIICAWAISDWFTAIYNIFHFGNVFLVMKHPKCIQNLRHFLVLNRNHCLDDFPRNRFPQLVTTWSSLALIN